MSGEYEDHLKDLGDPFQKGFCLIRTSNLRLPLIYQVHLAFQS